MYRILLLGASGQLGSALRETLGILGNIYAPNRAELDLQYEQDLNQYTFQLRPQIIVNCAAYTQVDQAEQDLKQALILNEQLPKHLANIARELDCFLIHFSTDYVYSGESQEPWRESDPTEPLQHYGVCKLKGDQAIERSGCRYLIFRTSWLFSGQSSNFMLTMLKLAEKEQILRVVNDQFGAPTSARSVAMAVTYIVERLQALPAAQAKMLSGIYHLSAAGACNWYQFACEIIQKSHALGLIKQLPHIEEISSEQLNRAAKRPNNSRLSNQKIAHNFGVSLASWQQLLDEELKLLALAGASAELR